MRCVDSPQTKDAFRLFMAGEECLSRVSANGIKIDRGYYAAQRPVIEAEVARLHNAILTSTDIGGLWQRRFGDKTNLDSSQQLVEVLKKDLQFDKFKKTDKGGDSADKDVIAKLPYEFSSLFLKFKQMQKAWSSLITPIVINADENDFVHPNFNLHTVRTYRSSCDGPNLQQMAKHNTMMKNLVRTGFIPRTKDRQLVEIDLRSNEVTVGACLHKDKQMLIFLNDPNADMHATVMNHFYKFTENDIADSKVKKIFRNSVKGRFVFASFYGAGPESMAMSFWDFVCEEPTRLCTGKTIAEHMAGLGVIDYPSMFAHVQTEFDWYWQTLFAEYNAWKEAVWQQYLIDGYIDLPTGFRVVAAMRKTQAMNVSVQGSAFHVLLAILIGLVKRMEKYKLKSHAICQIHDSVLLDAIPAELPTIYNLYLDAQEDVRKMWPWLIYTITAEAELSDIGGNWANMHDYGIITRTA